MAQQKEVLPDTAEFAGSDLGPDIPDLRGSEYMHENLQMCQGFCHGPSAHALDFQRWQMQLLLGGLKFLIKDSVQLLL